MKQAVRVVGLVALGVSMMTWAQGAQAQNQGGGSDQNGSGVRSVPEFDPTAAGAIAVLLGFGTVYLVRRRKD
jgi:hypothetical protein